MVDIVEAISIACSAAGWCLVQYSSHNCLLGYWPPEGQDEIWGATPDAMVAGVLIPSMRPGRARGRRLAHQRDAGRSRAGSTAPTGLSPTAFTEDGDKPRLAQMHAIPRGEYEIIDTWHTAGLRGTGSADVAVDDVFVPDCRALTIDATKGGGTAPGCAVNDAALYKLPAYAMFSINQSVPALGVAQAVYDDFVARTRDRVARMSGKSMADYSTAQVKVAEAHTKIETARLLLHHCCDKGMAIAESGGFAPMPKKSELRAQATMAGKLAAEAVDLLFHLSGGAGLYDSNPLSRAMRDVNCIRGHITQNWDVNASNHGRVLLGLPSADPGL